MRRAAKLTDRDLGIAGYVAVEAPTRRKGDGAYTVRTVQGPYREGETPDVAQAFADAQLASLATYRAAHPVQPCAPVAKCKHSGPANIYGTGDQSGPHTGDCKYLAPRTGNVYGSAADVAGIARLAAELDARKGRAVSPLAIEASENVAPVRKARARKVAESPRVAEIREAIAEPEPEPVDLAADPEPERCDRCAMVGHTAVDCIVAAPEQREVRRGPLDVAADMVAGPGYILPRALAPVVPAPAPVTRSRPTCPRCGQTFRLSGNGYAWHVANRPDCAAGRSAAAA